MLPTEQKTNSKIDISTPVECLKGVGPARAKAFAQLGVKTVGDLLEYFPRDWVFAPKAIKINQIKSGDTATIIGLVESTDYRSFHQPPIFEAFLSDDTGTCQVVWFRGGFLRNQLTPGQVIIASGKVNSYKHHLQMTNPRFFIIERDNVTPQEYFSGGVYPACSNLTSSQIKKTIKVLLEDVDRFVGEIYSEDFCAKSGLINRKAAFAWIHQPPDESKLAAAKKRLKYDELFLMQLGLALRRFGHKHLSSAIPCMYNEEINRRIRKRFPFLLTPDQDAAIADIIANMTKAEPMNRLLQGDVGSGKTVVALFAALLAIASKMQVAIMAPTEILAAQHFISIERYLKNSKVRRTCITGGLTGTKRKNLLEKIKNGQIDIVVGTVALLQQDIEFSNLGLVIIDEQHKFGVEQRAQLRKKSSPHCLVMTATPIPRTLAMTAFGDLDVSVIKHCPPGRGRVITRWVKWSNRQQAYEFIRERLRAKKQAYFVYPRIANTQENTLVKTASAEFKFLSKEIFPEFKVGLLHGQMPSAQKEQIMDNFRKGKIDVLVATVVVEVGLDVPNATMMVIEGADRFGLAQLHQLRGRIGRGHAKSYCFLFAASDNEAVKSRLDVITTTNDGFEIAEQDLKLRGPGELFSTRQHGLPDLKIANIIEDYDLLVAARQHAFQLVNQDPMLKNPTNKRIRQALIARFGDFLGLADVA